MLPPLLQFCRVTCILIPLAATTTGAWAKDFFGNNTPWSNADTRLQELAAARERSEWQRELRNARQGPDMEAAYQQILAQRIAASNTARRFAEAAAAERRRDERRARAAEELRLNPPRPKTWAEQMADYVSFHGDAQPEAREQLAFHYVRERDFMRAEHLLGIIAMSARPRAGEAQWVLAMQLYGAGGYRPDPARAAEHRRQAFARGYYRGLLDQAELQLDTDRAAAVESLETVVRGSDASSASYAARHLVETYTNHGKTIPELLRAAELRNQLERELMNIDPTFDVRLARQFIEAPGGWNDHPATILALLHRAAPSRTEASADLALVYLGEDPAARAVVAADPAKALAALGQLATRSPIQAGKFLPRLLADGPHRSPDLAALILRGLAGEYPNDARVPLQLAGVYAGDCGPLAPAEFARARDFFATWRARADAPAGIVTAAARFLEAHPATASDPAKELFALYGRPAAQKDYYAQYRYARALARGEGITADLPAALAYLDGRTARSEKVPVDAFPLYVLHARLLRESAPPLSGLLGHSQKLRDARSYARYAADAGDPLGLHEHAACIHRLAHTALASPIEDYEKEEAFKRAERAARTGLTEARLLVAQFYREGFGTAADPAKALEIYTEAAAAGVPGANARRAELLLAADSPVRDPAAGFALATEAAAAGDPLGRFLLAECHARGWGTPVDAARAHPLYAAAAEAGWPAAMSHVGLAQLETLTPDNYASTVALLSVPALQNDTAALRGLLRAVFLDPRRRAADQKALIGMLEARYDGITDAQKETLDDARLTLGHVTGELEAVLERRGDLEALYQTGLLLENQPNTIASPFGFTRGGWNFFRIAAQRGHPGAQYRRALDQFIWADDWARGSTNPETLERAEEERMEARAAMRAAAASGHAPALAWLKKAGLPLEAEAEKDQAEDEGNAPTGAGK